MEICDRCNRPSATQEDYDDPKHPPGCECKHCASLCWGDNCKTFDWKARVSELEIQVDTLVGHLSKVHKEREQAAAKFAEALNRAEQVLRDYCMPRMMGPPGQEWDFKEMAQLIFDAVGGEAEETDCDGYRPAHLKLFKDCDGNGWYGCRECARLRTQTVALPFGEAAEMPVAAGKEGE